MYCELLFNFAKFVEKWKKIGLLPQAANILQFVFTKKFSRDNLEGPGSNVATFCAQNGFSLKINPVTLIGQMKD